MVTAILLAMMGILLVVETVETAMHVALFTREFRKEKTKKADEKVEHELRKQAPDPIDEGFENIMRYAVNGKTGFEQE